jgi:hypothetical protein
MGALVQPERIHSSIDYRTPIEWKSCMLTPSPNGGEVA